MRLRKCPFFLLLTSTSVLFERITELPLPRMYSLRCNMFAGKDLRMRAKPVAENISSYSYTAFAGHLLLGLVK